MISSDIKIMKNKNSWQALFLSFWSKDFYVEVAREWRGLGYVYLLILVAFTSTFIAAKLQMQFSLKVDRYFIPMLSELPKITIKDGTLSIDRPSPYTIRSKMGDLVIMFDTRPAHVTLKESKANALVTSTDVYYGPESPYDLHIPISELKDGDLDARAIVDLATQLKTWMTIGLFLAISLYNFSWIALQSLLFALIVRRMSKLSAAKLDYETLVRLLVVAATPAQLIYCLVVLNDAIDSWSWLVGLLWCCYLFFALNANADVDAGTLPKNPKA